MAFVTCTPGLGTNLAHQSLPALGSQGKLDHLSKVPQIPSLNMLPREVRDCIYKYAIVGEVDMKQSALLPGLRGNPQLYQEALCAYYRMVECKLWVDDYAAIDPLCISTLTMVKKVRLIFPFIMNIRHWSSQGYGAVFYPAKNGSFKVNHLFLTVEELRIRISDVSGMCGIILFLRHNYLPKLRKLVIEDVMNLCADIDDGAKVDEWNELFGVPAKLLTVPSTPATTIESYFWVAKEDEYLKTIY